MQTNTDIDQGLAQTVSAALRGAGIAQREAAAMTGIPISTLSRRLTGNSSFTVTELALIARLLGVKVSDFFARGAA